MTMDKRRYGRALKCNIFELCDMLSYRNAYVTFQSIAHRENLSFFSYAADALYNGIFFHAIKVFDKNKESASFYYIHNCNKASVNKELDKQNLSIEEIETVSAKLKTIRDKTHFHIDKKFVIDPQAAWKKANLTGTHLSQVADKLWLVLNELHVLHFNQPSGYFLYDAADISSIIDAVKKSGITI
jgi:hypothetical protein